MKMILLVFIWLYILNLFRGLFSMEIGVAKAAFNVTELCSTLPDWTLFFDQYDCHKFYACVGHITEEFSCAENYYFDKLELRCLLGNCPDEMESNQQKCVTKTIRRADDNCSAFEVCSDDKFHREYCASGYYFNPLLSICSPIANTPEHKCSCIFPEYTVLSNDADCETYYICVNGRAQLVQCPRGQYYDEEVNTCLPDVDGICLMEPTISAIEATDLELCDVLATNEGTTFQQFSNDCTKFLVCFNGRAIVKSCQPGFYYDKEDNFCRTNEGLTCNELKK